MPQMHFLRFSNTPLNKGTRGMLLIQSIKAKGQVLSKKVQLNVSNCNFQQLKMQCIFTGMSENAVKTVEQCYYVPEMWI